MIGNHTACSGEELLERLLLDIPPVFLIKALFLSGSNHYIWFGVFACQFVLLLAFSQWKNTLDRMLKQINLLVRYHDMIYLHKTRTIFLSSCLVGTLTINHLDIYTFLNSHYHLDIYTFRHSLYHLDIYTFLHSSTFSKRINYPHRCWINLSFFPYSFWEFPKMISGVLLSSRIKLPGPRASGVLIPSRKIQWRHVLSWDGWLVDYILEYYSIMMYSVYTVYIYTYIYM